MEHADPARYGDADLSSVSWLFGDASRVRLLAALLDGRSLPASVLASEAGLSAPAASAQLRRLLEAGVVGVERSGRHRYYRLADPGIVDVLEAMARMAPARPVRSMREGTRAHALRRGRTCYDHLAGQLGVAVTAALVDREVLVASDGRRTTQRRPDDRLSAQLGTDLYALGPAATQVLPRLGVDADTVAASSRRPLLRFCLDWSEQRHHLAGALGAAVCSSFLDHGWVVRRQGQRAVDVTHNGRVHLHQVLTLQLEGA
ncbi:MAG: ArsR/SmtB family transcription factor [Marmoricola sp.]